VSVVLGIDPGSRITGYGVIGSDGNRLRYLDAGTIRTLDGEPADRLRRIFEGIARVIGVHRPDEVAVEKVFMNNNAGSALKLGQARGVAIAAAGCADVAVFEYSATQIKQAIVGRGHADKRQVQHMVKVLLGLPEAPTEDAADALAAAICHANTRIGLQRVAVARGTRQRRAR
jgi:crossover junction endodeoxyribonuclease RuvC